MITNLLFNFPLSSLFGVLGTEELRSSVAPKSTPDKSSLGVNLIWELVGCVFVFLTIIVLVVSIKRTLYYVQVKRHNIIV